MAKHNAANERIKREYFGFLREAKGRDESTIDRVAMALARFEDSTNSGTRKDFRKFHREQAVSFKKRLAEAVNGKTGKKLSKSTIASILRDLKAFFEWLSREPGYRSKIEFSDADYFNLNERDAAIARSRREKEVPTIEQVDHVLRSMPTKTVVQRRDRALVAFASLTAARVNALASLQLGDVNIEQGYVEQDARHVRTKFAKSFRTYFMPVCEGAKEIVEEWVVELREQHLWSDCDPLFPSTVLKATVGRGFQPVGIKREAWSTTQPIRQIFKRAFDNAGLPYFNPHSFRDMLVQHAMRLDLTPEQMKAWSQNLGHEQVMTTLTSYGKVPVHRQGELIGQMKAATQVGEIANLGTAELLSELARRHG